MNSSINILFHASDTGSCEHLHVVCYSTCESIMLLKFCDQCIPYILKFDDTIFSFFLLYRTEHTRLESQI